MRTQKKIRCLDPDLLSLCERYGASQSTPHYASVRACISVSLARSLEDIEKSVILATLREYGYDRWQTARSLGIGLRTLERRLRRYKKEESEEIA